MPGTFEERRAPVTEAVRRFDPEPWRRELLVFVRRMGAAADAEDVVQEAFARAIANPPRTHPRAWLYRVALNVLRDRGRREGTASEARDSLARHRSAAAAPADPASLVERRDLAEAAWRAVSGLPPMARAAVLLRVQRHMDYDEVSIALGCSVAAARQHFHVGVKRVRDVLGSSADA
jgi:RNA polymerase sigma-70 factor (ECF subfamily)